MYLFMVCFKMQSFYVRELMHFFKFLSHDVFLSSDGEILDNVHVSSLWNDMLKEYPHISSKQQISLRI